MSGTLAFRNFPASSWRPSGVNIEFDASQANTATQNQRALLIGQILSSGTATPNVPVLAYSQAQVNTLCGATSMLALMYAAYVAQDPFGEVWLGPVSDAGGGTAATGSLSVTGPATAAGTLAFYVMGVSVPVAVSVGDSAATIAGNIFAAFGGSFFGPGRGTPLPLASVTLVGGSPPGVSYAAAHKGLALTDIDIRLNYRGAQNGEVTPAGVGITITAMSGGATNPTLTTLLANCANKLFDFIALPYTDATSLDALKNFLSDATGRWSAQVMQYGHVFSAYRGTVSGRGTFGNTRNDQHCSILGFYNSPTPAWLEAADWCGVHARILKGNPAVGVTDLALGLLPPPQTDEDTPGNRNTLLYDGISTYTVAADGTCRIDRSITTYQTNAAGLADNSYLNTNLLFQAMYAARYIAAQLTSQYIAAGKILVDNGTPIPPGSPATTPDRILGTAIGIYAYLCTQFVVQDADTFARNATASKGQKGQVLLFLPLDFSDQVISIAILAQFIQTT